MFAGPNGSGKTTLAKQLIKEHQFPTSPFVNADEIEQEIQNLGFLDFEKYDLSLEIEEIKNFFTEIGMSITKTQDLEISNRFSSTKRRLNYDGQINSYIASDLAGYIRERLLDEGKDFWFETVFSHNSKLKFMEKAKSMGYKVYFYFIATDATEININRVINRVEKNGHPVPEDKIISRYYRSLQLLYPAIKVSDRAFLFDNSQRAAKFVCEIEDGLNAEMNVKNPPNWFVEYFYNKSIENH